MEEWKRGMYIVTMAIVVICAGIFLTQIVFPGEDNLLFRFNAFGIIANITTHFIVNFFIIAILLRLYIISCKNYLMTVDTKHVTTISKK